MQSYRQASKGLRKFWLIIPGVMAFCLVWQTVTYAISLTVYVVPTVSMSPTIAPGDRICAEAIRATTPKRAEIWVLTMPSGGIAVKRIVGLPGETIEVTGGRVLIDGKPLAEPYLNGPIAYSMAPVRLNRRKYFVLGDNRNLSFDSHIWGATTNKHLIGRATFRPWPPARISGLR